MSLSRAHAGPEQQCCCPAAGYVSVPCDMKAPQLFSVANSERVMLHSVGLKGQTIAQHVSHQPVSGVKKVMLATQMPRLHSKRVGGA